MDSSQLQSIGQVSEQLASRDYLADEDLATAIFLALKMERPLFLEGEPGVGKTETAKVLAEILETELIRLQCYEGIDTSEALYEWDYPRQLLAIQAQARGLDSTADSSAGSAGLPKAIYDEEFLLRRPLLRAIDPKAKRPPVLLIDELDRADDEFESFLLELLSDFQVTIPEIGTVRAVRRPVVVVTSNRTREIHDALKRRCVYHWIDYPSHDRELDILRAKVPGLGEELCRQVVAFVQTLRGQELSKRPGISETLDWAEAAGTPENPWIGACTRYRVRHTGGWHQMCASHA